MNLLDESNYQNGFLVSDNHMIGVGQNEQLAYFVFLLALESGTYEYYNECDGLQLALDQANTLVQKTSSNWSYEAVKSCGGNCKEGQCIGDCTACTSKCH
ncbi:MAG: hypothetical protein AB7F43_11510 [Bacteriovoracia bacterium]